MSATKRCNKYLLLCRTRSPSLITKGRGDINLYLRFDLTVYCAQFLRDEMEDYYAAIETDDDIWYNAADVQLIYSTASEGGGQFRHLTRACCNLQRSTFNWIFHPECCYLSRQSKCIPFLACCCMAHNSITGSHNSYTEPWIRIWIVLLTCRNGCLRLAGSVLRGVHLELLVDHQPPTYSPYSSFWKVSVHFKDLSIRLSQC